jgi:uncharacterized protein
MTYQNQMTTVNMSSSEHLKVLREACKKIAPVWPLENFVAVNPYLGHADQTFESTAQTLAKIGGIQMALPLSFYLQKIKEGRITRSDLQSVLSKKSKEKTKIDDFIALIESATDETTGVSTVATLEDVATQVTGKDWSRFATSRISTWAASYFDDGQASWAAADQQASLFSAWKFEAEVDNTTDIMGLKGFRKAAKSLPGDPVKAMDAALQILEMQANMLPIYLHRLLLSVGGWSAFAARLDWESELNGGKDGKLMEFLIVLLCWEACLFQALDSPKLRVKWLTAKKSMLLTSTPSEINQQLTQKLILQEAFDQAAQREIIQKFKEPKAIKSLSASQVKAQAIFCIDVRSEVYRRNLELVDQGIDTIGFAGFFAFPINYVPIAHDHGVAQCPVLITTGATILEEIPDKKTHEQARKSRTLKHQVQHIWKSFRSGAITCFSFVSPLGLSYLPKLFTDSFGLSRPVPHPDHVGLKDKYLKLKGASLNVATHGNVAAGIPLEQRVQMGKNALNAMSLTSGFARFVLIVGHGSTTVNNPHASGLDCGACGGRSGEPNAKVAAAVLNDRQVRQLLKAENIHIPDTTVFLCCLHDTTTDEVTIFNEQEVPASRANELEELKISLAKAGHASRTERALRMTTKGNVDDAIMKRSKDWSQVRPEWGLAGCSAFVVAPRFRTKDLDLQGRSFLHSYDWKKDEGFKVLELIMTAPMVVTSWINLQYFASTVDNKNFGSGNKTLHNVTGGVGVLEGFSGDLRVGLPIQSVHDGKNFQHEPIRLKVIIEAPIDAINAVLEKHASIRNLCDNEWIHLLSMNEEGMVACRYAGNLLWEEIGAVGV